jgi:phosphoribosylanthranilate isomerase
MSTAIKICGMRDPENILAAAELKPDFLGFIFYPESPRYAGNKLKPEILLRLHSSIKKTGVFVNSDINLILDTVSKFSLDAVQLHGNESPELCSGLKDAGLQVIKAFNTGETIERKMYDDFIECTDYFLFDSKTVNFGGSGQKFDWSLLERNDPGHPFILSGGIGPSDSGRISLIKNNSFHGVDLNSRFEIEPGLKDIEKLKKFINELRDNQY